MKLVNQSFEILNSKSEDEILKSIEYAGRMCYKSHEKITSESCRNFVKNIIKCGHYSVLEHESIQVRLVIDRGVLAELTRHRIGIAFSVESTRYCNYNKDDDISFIDPACGQYDNIDDLIELDKSRYLLHCKSYEIAEKAYKDLIEMGATPQEARQVLPMSLKTELIMTANLREWRHIFELRCSDKAHPHCKDIFNKILKCFQKEYPSLFGDLTLNSKWS